MLFDEKRWGKPIEMPEDTEAWRQVLLSAAEVIEKKGWCRFSMENAKGQVCLLGAFNHAEGKSSDKDIAKAKLSEYLGVHYIQTWNDKRWSSRPVLKALRKAAAK